MCIICWWSVLLHIQLYNSSTDQIKLQIFWWTSHGDIQWHWIFFKKLKYYCKYRSIRYLSELVPRISNYAGSIVITIFSIYTALPLRKPNFNLFYIEDSYAGLHSVCWCTGMFPWLWRNRIRLISVNLRHTNRLDFHNQSCTIVKNFLENWPTETCPIVHASQTLTSKQKFNSAKTGA